MKIKIVYDSVCYQDRNLSNEKNLEASVKVANENSLSADDEDGRRVLYFTDTCFINTYGHLYLNFFHRHQKIERYPFQFVFSDKRNYTIVAE